ncbi:hypothetical protein FLAT13_03322 [Flavobacterium salmonis]|uniref:Uncharacterized protein n=1 Tax=Flavobacterium salmonis TaxID=2654844 RepID=A0A6V6Z3T0_9FLAO|nr:hypothetical protein FLAT13_03322 [Flavobacterium salmonis]
MSYVLTFLFVTEELGYKKTYHFAAAFKKTFAYLLSRLKIKEY